MTPAGAVVGPVPPGRDPESYDRLRRRVLWSMPSGLYVVGTRAGDRRNLMTVSWVTQVSMDPKLLGIGVESGAVTHGLLVDGGVFTLNVLPRSERALVRRFAKPVTELELDASGSGTMEGQRVHAGTTGAPVLDVARAVIECEVRHVLALGSHSWFVGEVVDCAETEAVPARSDGEPPRRDADDDGVLRMEDTRMSYGG